MRRHRILALTVLALLLFGVSAPVMAGEGKTLVLGQRLFGELSAGESVNVGFYGLPDTLATFKCVGWKAGGIVPELEIRTPNGTLIDAGNYTKIASKGRGLKITKLPLSEAGVYTINVRGHLGMAGGFDLVTKGKYPRKVKEEGTVADPATPATVTCPALPGDSLTVKVKGIGKNGLSPLIVRYISCTGKITELGAPKKAGPIAVDAIGDHRFEIGALSGTSGPFKIKISLKRGKPDKTWLDADDVVATGSISGSLIVEGQTGGAGKTLSGNRARKRARAEPEVRAGELVVDGPGLVSEESVLAALRRAAPALTFRVLHSMTDRGPHLVAITGIASKKKRRNQRKTVAAAKALSATASIAWAEPNQVSRPAREPNDPYWAWQHNLRLLRLPEAWEITTGSSSIVVAVVDSGIWPTHPDLETRLLTGYDFVMDANDAMDGDGWDGDPTDSALDFHGTHVAGIIGAAAGNRAGIAGVVWDARILPVRALGETGGTDYDIAAGIRWAAGLTVGGVPANPDPARVINLSFGGYYQATVEREAVAAAIQAGVVIVAAAGNEDVDDKLYPAAYPGVISVSAVAPDLSPASYSNYGSWVSVSAPGGDQSVGLAGILSTYVDGLLHSPTYTELQGTSMASPHVAGVAALMLAENKNLSVAQVKSILEETAFDLGSAGHDDYYGWGLVDAEAAVREASGGANLSPILSVIPPVLYLSPEADSATLYVTNTGVGSITDIAVTATADDGGSWLSATTAATEAPMTVTVTVLRSGLAEGLHTGMVEVVTSAGTAKVPVRVVSRPPPDIGTVSVMAIDRNGHVAARTTTSAALGYVYTLSDLSQGTYTLEAWGDTDADGELDRIDEWTGEWPVLGGGQTIQIRPGALDHPDRNFPLARADAWFQFDGVGGGPIQGALAVRVFDAWTREPIESARAYIGVGGITAVTDERGRAMLTGSFANGQTVTVAADGYDTMTQLGSDAQYQSFAMYRYREVETAELTVNVLGLDWYDWAVYVQVGEEWDWVYYDGYTPPSVTFDVPLNRPNLPVSVVAYDFDDFPSKVSLDLLDEITTPTPPELDLYAWSPDGWYVMYPTYWFPQANFTRITGSLQATVDFYWTVEDSSTIGISPLEHSVEGRVYWPSFGSLDWVLESTITFSAWDSLDRYSGHAITNYLNAFPAAPKQTLLSPPSLTTPDDGAVIQTKGRIFTITPTPDASVTFIYIVDIDTGDWWDLQLPGVTTSFILPEVPEGGLRSGHRYVWWVACAVIRDFSYTSYLDDAFGARMTDWTESETWGFTVK